MATEGLQSTHSRDVLGYMYPRLTELPANWVSQVGMYIPSDQASETHKWLGMAPVMREWIGGRQKSKPKDYGITIVNKKFEATMGLSVDEIRRDKIAQVQLRIDDLVRRANGHWTKITSELIDAAESTVCYDGQFLVDTDHVDGDSGTLSNDVTFAAATGTTPTVSEMVDAILASIQQMYTFKDDQGEPINQDVSNFLVMVPTTYWSVAHKAVVQELIASGETNALNGVNLNVVLNPRLTWTTKMMTFAVDSPVKPIILQDEVPVSISSMAEGSEHEHKFDEHEYGVKAVRNVGPGMWQSCCMTTFT
jgi:phage major head subunit gpT-like protein